MLRLFRASQLKERNNKTPHEIGFAEREKLFYYYLDVLIVNLLIT